MTTLKLNVDIIPGTSAQSVSVSQGDHESRTLLVTLLQDNKTDFTIPAGATVEIRGTKPSGKGFNYGCTFSGNVVTVNIKDQMTAEPGKVPCEISIESNGRTLSSANFDMYVERAALQPGTVASSDTFDSLVRKVVINAEGNLFTNALKGQASGASVQPTDVSPLAHNPVVRVHGKNIFDPKIMETKYDYDGLAITRNGDEITINGTARTTHSRPVIDILQPINKGKTYTCTIFRVSGSGDRLVVSYGLGTQKGIREEFYDCTSVSGRVSDYRVFTANYKYLTRFLMYFQEGATFNNLVIKIQLEESPATTAYEPWVDPTGFKVTDGKGNAYTPNADGLVEGVTSTSPTMTLSLDKEGAVIDCEYNRDLTAVISKLEAALLNN